MIEFFSVEQKSKTISDTGSMVQWCVFVILVAVFNSSVLLMRFWQQSRKPDPYVLAADGMA